MSAYLVSIGTANPSFKISQSRVLHFMTRAHQLNEKEAHDLAVLYRASGIQHRYTALDDYNKTDNFTFFPNTPDLEPFPDTKKRQEVYREEAIRISTEAAQKALASDNPKNITHLITVSCTGMYAPGLDIDLVNALGLNTNVQRTSINFMGCYAAFNALKAAYHICRSEKAKVLIVCTELCTIHFQKEKTDDNLLANALFGDGSAAAIVSSEPGNEWILRLDDFSCDLVPSGSKEMAWEIGNLGFEMKLSSYVPDAIQQGINPLIDQLRSRQDIDDFDYYAIHPGGKRILSVVEERLGITREQNQFSHEVLREYGNMSSPTVLFVLEKILGSMNGNQPDQRLLSFAFGPGLTLESFVGTLTKA